MCLQPVFSYAPFFPKFLQKALKRELLLLIANRFRKCEGAFNDADFNRICCQDLNDIEPEGQIGHVEKTKPMDRSSTDELLFLPIDGIQRASEFLGAASLYLRKDQSLMVTTDEIDLAAMGSTEVPSQDFPTKAS